MSTVSDRSLDDVSVSQRSPYLLTLFIVAAVFLIPVGLAVWFLIIRNPVTYGSEAKAVADRVEAEAYREADPDELKYSNISVFSTGTAVLLREEISILTFATEREQRRTTAAVGAVESSLLAKDAPGYALQGDGFLVLVSDENGTVSAADERELLARMRDRVGGVEVEFKGTGELLGATRAADDINLAKLSPDQRIAIPFFSALAQSEPAAGFAVEGSPAFDYAVQRDIRARAITADTGEKASLAVQAQGGGIQVVPEEGPLIAYADFVVTNGKLADFTQGARPIAESMAKNLASAPLPGGGVMEYQYAFVGAAGADIVGEIAAGSLPLSLGSAIYIGTDKRQIDGYIAASEVVYPGGRAAFLISFADAAPGGAITADAYDLDSYEPVQVQFSLP